MTIYNKTHISVVIPAYNEVLFIVNTIKEVVFFFEKKKEKYEILVVNDGSTDATAKVVSEICKTNQHIKLISFKKNMGKGYVVKKGILKASGKYILFMDADHSVHINTLESFLFYIQLGFDIVIASIAVQGSLISDSNKTSRRYLGRLSRILIRYVAVPEIFDTQRGFKLFKNEIAKDIFSSVTVPRWGFDIELLVIAQKRKYKIKEHPVVWSNSKISTIGYVDYVRTLRELFIILFRKILGLY